MKKTILLLVASCAIVAPSLKAVFDDDDEATYVSCFTEEFKREKDAFLRDQLNQRDSSEDESNENTQKNHKPYMASLSDVLALNPNKDKNVSREPLDEKQTRERACTVAEIKFNNTPFNDTPKNNRPKKNRRSFFSTIRNSTVRNFAKKKK